MSDVKFGLGLVFGMDGFDKRTRANKRIDRLKSLSALDDKTILMLEG